MMSGFGTKIRACAELIRLDLAFGAGFFVVAGEIFATGGMPPVPLVLAGFLALFCISGTANIANDYFDREVDRINLPARPLPSGRITVRELWILFCLVTAAGLAAAAFLGPPVLALVVVLWGLSLLYNIRFKEYGIAGNLLVAFCVGMTVILGGIAAGTINGVVLTFAALAFLFDLGEEIAADAMDIEGDRQRSSRSLAKSRGRGSALRVSAFLFCVFFVLALVPFLAGWLGYAYLFLAAVTDLWMIRCTANLVRDRTIEQGRVEIRRLYLSWGLFVILVTLTRLL